MGIEQQIDDTSATQARGNVELGCALVFTALYWPFMSCAVVTFNVLLRVPKEPFDWNISFGATMIVLQTSLQVVNSSLSPEDRNNWRAVARQYLRVAPFLLIMLLINVAAGSLLQYGWSTANRYPFILFGSFTLGAVCTACTYVLWRLLVSPILNPRQSSPTK